MAATQSTPQTPRAARTPQFPLATPPRCRDCRAEAGDRRITLADNENGNGARPFYTCPQSHWITWDDDRGIDANNPPCRCKPGSPSRRDHVGKRKPNAGDEFWKCATGTCWFYEWDEREQPTVPLPPRVLTTQWVLAWRAVEPMWECRLTVRLSETNERKRIRRAGVTQPDTDPGKATGARPPSPPPRDVKVERREQRQESPSPEERRPRPAREQQQRNPAQEQRHRDLVQAQQRSSPEVKQERIDRVLRSTKNTRAVERQSTTPIVKQEATVELEPGIKLEPTIKQEPTIIVID